MLVGVQTSRPSEFKIIFSETSLEKLQLLITSIGTRDARTTCSESEDGAELSVVFLIAVNNYFKQTVYDTKFRMEIGFYKGLVNLV